LYTNATSWDKKQLNEGGRYIFFRAGVHNLILLAGQKIVACSRTKTDMFLQIKNVSLWKKQDFGFCGKDLKLLRATIGPRAVLFACLF
jgi:hypothetical protein